MVRRNIPGKKLNDSIKWLRENTESSPDIGNEIEALLECARAGGAIEDKYYLKLINDLVSLISERIRNEKIIEDQNDVFFAFLEQCREAAIDGVKISENIVTYWPRFADTYLKYKEYGPKVCNRSRYSLKSLYQARLFLIRNDGYLCENVSRMLDFIEATHRVNGEIPRTERFYSSFIFPYFSNGSSDELYSRMMHDLNIYIYPQEQNNALESCKRKISLPDVPLYVQLFILLEHNIPFDEIYRFIEKEVPINLLDTISKELIKYSKRGIDFYRYIKEKQEQPITESDEDLFKMITDKNTKYDEELREIKNKKRNTRNCFFDSTFFTSRKEEYNYLNNQKRKFKLSKALLSEDKRKGIIFVSKNDYYAITKVTDCNRAALKCYNFENGGNTDFRRDVSDNEIKELTSLGNIFIELESNNGLIKITIFIPDLICEYQSKVLQEIKAKLLLIKPFVESDKNTDRKQANLEQINNAEIAINNALKRYSEKVVKDLK